MYLNISEKNLGMQKTLHYISCMWYFLCACLYSVYWLQYFFHSNYSMNKRDKKMLWIFHKAKLLVIDIILSDQVIAEAIESVSNLISVNYQKRAWLRIPESYIHGVNSVKKDIKLPKTNTKTIWQATANVSISLWQLWPKHTKAVSNIIAQSIWYNAQALKDFEQNIKLLKWIWDTEKIFNIITSSGSNFEKKNALSTNLKDSGIAYLKDKDWIKRDIDRYAEMLVRTETSATSNQGTINRAIELWIDLLERSEVSDSCPVCRPHDWEIRSLSKQWMPKLLYHPNCRWEWIAKIL